MVIEEPHQESKVMMGPRITFNVGEGGRKTAMPWAKRESLK